MMTDHQERLAKQLFELHAQAVGVRNMVGLGFDSPLTKGVTERMRQDAAVILESDVVQELQANAWERGYLSGVDGMETGRLPVMNPYGKTVQKP